MTSLAIGKQSTPFYCTDCTSQRDGARCGSRRSIRLTVLSFSPAKIKPPISTKPATNSINRLSSSQNCHSGSDWRRPVTIPFTSNKLLSYSVPVPALSNCLTQCTKSLSSRSALSNCKKFAALLSVLSYQVPVPPFQTALLSVLSYSGSVPPFQTAKFAALLRVLSPLFFPLHSLEVITTLMKGEEKKEPTTVTGE